MKTGKEIINEINGINPPFGSFAFWWLGQLGYAIKLGESAIYIDAYLSPHRMRQVPPVIMPEDIDNASIIIGSHDHIDHIDRPAWKVMAKTSPEAKFVAPAPFVENLSETLDISRERLFAADENKTLEINGIKITPIAAAHELLEYKDGHSAFLSFIIEGNGVKLFHAGDTCIYEGYQTKLKEQGKFDAAFLPINGRDAKRLRSNCIGNMTYQEAVDLAGALKPGLTVPGHYEMFANNSCDPELFRDYLDAKYPGLKCWIGEHGELVEVKGGSV